MLIGIGVDLFRIARIAQQSVSGNDPFLMRSYTPRERAEAESRTAPLLYYAARFAAKEAVYKAISACKGEFCPGDIEIVDDADGRPQVKLLGRTAEAFQQYTGGAYSISVSLSYDTDYASAFAVAEKL